MIFQNFGILQIVYGKSWVPEKLNFYNELLSKETQRINKDISIIDTHDHFQYPINIRITRWKLVYSPCKVQSWIYSSLNDFEVWDEAINPTFDVALLAYPIKLNISKWRNIINVLLWTMNYRWSNSNSCDTKEISILMA